jgi:hypothetical protein
MEYGTYIILEKNIDGFKPILNDVGNIYLFTASETENYLEDEYLVIEISEII